MLDLILEETKEKMEKSIEAFKHELSSCLLYTSRCV